MQDGRETYLLLMVAIAFQRTFTKLMTIYSSQKLKSPEGKRLYSSSFIFIELEIQHSLAAFSQLTARCIGLRKIYWRLIIGKEEQERVVLFCFPVPSS